ncbi:hypothetical protein L3Y34_006250 [Caenorhabditis briggsae]|uniref:Solute carrier family 40 member n=1 Tax=Caenorhabditis briggsae TaxID=6238 RepID=A0AAE9CY90_CAEBR|nr:hypothetical protein L3Y34_006250 [Caenorhabditis briggsae]
MFFGHSSICFSAINRLFLNAERSIMSRDWIVKILDSSRLSRQNATLTSLDQLINVLAPIGIGVGRNDPTRSLVFGSHHHAFNATVPEADRNTVFGSHMSLCQAFSMPKELLSSIPITFLLTPVLYVLVTMQLTYRNQNLSNVCVMLASSHGLFSTIVMVLVHQPYREATWNNLYFCFRCKRRNLKTTSGLVTISIWSIHENRYHVLFGADNNPIWCLMRKPMMLVNYFAAITYFIPPYFVLPDQNQEFVKIQEILPCNLQQAYASRKVFILSAGKDFPLYCCFVFYVLAVGQSIPLFFIIIIKLIRKSRKKESTASLKTLKMRKKLVIALIIQVDQNFQFVVG